MRFIFVILFIFLSIFIYAKPCAPVMGYLASWSNPPGWTLDSIDWEALTHVIDTFAIPVTNSATGAVSMDVTNLRKTNLIYKAHSNNTKVMFSIGGANGSKCFRGATNSTNRTNFVNLIINFLTTYNYDGVDIDWEFPDSSDKDNFTLFMQELYSAIKSSGNDYFGQSRILTFYTTTGYFDSGVDWSIISNYCDYVIQSGYDWSNPYNAPLYNSGKYMTTQAGFYIQQSIDGFGQSLINRGVSASKFILGLPFYSVPDYVKYATVKSSGIYLGYDTEQEEARYYYNGKTRYVNTTLSFEKKFEYVFAKSRPGIAIWEITQIYPETDLWDTIKTSSCLGPPTPTPSPTITPTPETEANYSLKNIKIIPNPVVKKDEVTIKFKKVGYKRVRINIFTLAGELVKVIETRGEEVKWKITSTENYLLSNGIYIINFEGIDKYGNVYNEGSTKIAIKR